MKKRKNPLRKLIKTILPKYYSKKAINYYEFKMADAIIVSFPKSGRTWLRILLSEYYCDRYQLHQYETIKYENLNLINHKIPKMLFTHDDDYSKHWSDLDKEKRKYKKSKIIFLSRDPRDVVVSLYFHRLKRDRDLQESYTVDEFSTGDFGGVRTIIEFYNIWFDFLRKNRNSLYISYEALHSDTQGTLEKVLGFLGEEVDEASVLHAIKKSSFDAMKKKEAAGEYNMSILSPGDSDDPESFKVRKGKVSGYKDYLSAETQGELELVLKDRLNPDFPLAK